MDTCTAAIAGRPRCADRWLSCIARRPRSRVPGGRCKDHGMSTLQFDEDASRRIEATYTTADVVEQRRAVRAALELRPGDDVLDIGSGPGLLAFEMAAEVGILGSIEGVDPSESMLALARGRRRGEGSAEVRFVAGDACSPPGLSISSTPISPGG